VELYLHSLNKPSAAQFKKNTGTTLPLALPYHPSLLPPFLSSSNRYVNEFYSEAKFSSEVNKIFFNLTFKPGFHMIFGSPLNMSVVLTHPVTAGLDRTVPHQHGPRVSAGRGGNQ
jgi:hypothetical protein